MPAKIRIKHGPTSGPKDKKYKSYYYKNFLPVTGPWPKRLYFVFKNRVMPKSHAFIVHTIAAILLHMEPSIFTKIINGEVPCHKIYEDEKTIAILDIHPVQPGHVLVIPKLQIDHFEDLPDDIYQAVWATVKLVAHQQKKVLGRSRIAVSIVGTDVPHAHVHLMPFDETKDIHRIIDLTGEPDYVALASMAERLAIKDKTDE
ncbi:MAG TPA: HIT family protein [Patescibacteria group bacterium]|nr:HIT family protein [Patescibacteria group bacterium]